METVNLLNDASSVVLLLCLCIFFVIIGIFFSRNFKGLNNYLVADRSMGLYSLTSSLVASALGAWILFGPASAATWGGIGAVLGYALGTAFPLFALIKLGIKIREQYPNGKTITEVTRLRFGKRLFKLILLLSVFYMIIFLIAEVTAVAILMKYLSGTELWITAMIIISSSLIYTLYGGLRASIFTDNIQFLILLILLLISFSFLINNNSSIFSFNYVASQKPKLLSLNYYTNFTAGLTFFIAVSATNLFHQGNWQRVYSAKNNKVLYKSLIFSFLIIIPLVFIMGFTGLVAVSFNNAVVPDLAFFYLLLSEQRVVISLVIVFLAISLTVSSIDTLINAISSIIVVDTKYVINYKGDSLKLSKKVLVFICMLAFIVASKGLSILYLFLLADLFCCAAVLSIFYGFYKNNFNEKVTFISILVGLFAGLLFFPTPDFTKSILIGIIIPTKYVPSYISQSLLFISFILATFLPPLLWKIKINKK
ncbi:sodium:solute symporter [Alphaproteobacteria bacterium]|nr:sodium:solute symporter [Alphaproteobacteria bacterium]